MNYTSIFLKRAQKELQQAWIWYEDRQFNLGDRFFDEVKSRVAEIEQHPERYPQKKAPYRETAIKTFPYLIIYKIKRKQRLLLIVSIFHTSRNPSKKYSLKEK